MKVKGKIFKVGSSYGLRIPKVYVTDGNLQEGAEYEIEVLKKMEKDYSTKPLWYKGPDPFYSSRTCIIHAVQPFYTQKKEALLSS